MGSRPSRRRLAQLIGLLCSVTVWVVAGGVRAQDIEAKALARQLFEQGVQAVDRADWQAAEDCFRRSLTLKSSSVVRYNLASAIAKREKLVEAGELLRDVERDESAEPALRAAALTLRNQLAPRLGRITVHVTGAREGVELQLDERALPFAAVDVAAPIDPGAHHLLARKSAEQLTLRELDFEIAEGELKETTLELPEPPANAVAVLSQPPSAAETARYGKSPDARAVILEAAPTGDHERDHAGGSAWPWIVGGAGLLVATVVTIALLAGNSSDRTAQPVRGNLGSGIVVVDK